MHNNDKLSEHFSLGELIRSAMAERKHIDNTPPDEIAENLKYLCQQVLEPIRQHYGKPFRPNSCYRSPELNTAIGGSANSQHCKGEAVDIEVPGVSNYDLARWVEQNLEFDQLILECYCPGEPTSGWVHVSLKSSGQTNRKQVLTYSNRKYTPGLHP
jgi:hypothetical protein